MIASHPYCWFPIFEETIVLTITKHSRPAGQASNFSEHTFKQFLCLAVDTSNTAHADLKRIHDATPDSFSCRRDTTYCVSLFLGCKCIDLRIPARIFHLFFGLAKNQRCRCRFVLDRSLAYLLFSQPAFSPSSVLFPSLLLLEYRPEPMLSHLCPPQFCEKPNRRFLDLLATLSIAPRMSQGGICLPTTTCNFKPASSPHSIPPGLLPRCAVVSRAPLPATTNQPGAVSNVFREKVDSSSRCCSPHPPPPA